MKTQLNEIHKLQKIAGILKEEVYNDMPLTQKLKQEGMKKALYRKHVRFINDDIKDFIKEAAWDINVQPEREWTSENYRTMLKRLEEFREYINEVISNHVSKFESKAIAANQRRVR